jgi:hypothetical protein
MNPPHTEAECVLMSLFIIGFLAIYFFTLPGFHSSLRALEIFVRSKRPSKKPLDDYSDFKPKYASYTKQWQSHMEQWQKADDEMRKGKLEQLKKAADESWAVQKAKWKEEDKVYLARTKQQAKEWYDEVTKKPEIYYYLVGDTKVMSVTKEYANLTRREFSEKYPMAWQEMKAKAFELIMEEGLRRTDEAYVLISEEGSNYTQEKQVVNSLIYPYMNLRSPVDDSYFGFYED